MKDMKDVDKIVARRFSVRFDLPDQDIGNWSEESTAELMKDCLDKWWYIGSVERGKKKDRYHLQCYIETRTDSAIRAGTIIRAIRKHTDTADHRVSIDVSPARNSPARMVGYVTKEDTHIWGPYSNRPMDEWPTPSDAPKVSREDLYNAVWSDRLGIADILSDPGMSVAASTCMKWLASIIRERDGKQWGLEGTLRPIELVYLYGSSYTGKSSAARDYLASIVGQFGYFVVSDYRRDPWSKYACQQGVLFDDLRLPNDQIGFRDWLQLTDRFPLQLSSRYENSWAAFSHIVVTSNWSPEEQWASIKNAMPMNVKLNDEDRTGFYRRMTRILRVDEHGDLTDETAKYHKNIEGRGHVTADKMKAVMARPVEPLTEPTDPLAGLNIVRTGHANSIQEALEFFNLTDDEPDD